MNVLVLNCGSSSLKFQVIESDERKMSNDEDVCWARGSVERIGSHCLVSIDAKGRPSFKTSVTLLKHRDAIDYVLRWLIDPANGLQQIIGSLADIHAVGHRVVHGGDLFSQSILVDDTVIKGIEDFIDLAPLHNPANLNGIRAIREILGDSVPQVAVFDTAFHSTMPASSFLYAIPYQYYRRYKIRRYGFHGTSHRYVAYRFRKMMGIRKDQVNVISLHLGNGCSACAIQGGASVDTTMGMTPLEGLMMGTRSGSIDPGIMDYLGHKEGLSLNALDTLLNKQSGLLGVSGITNDMRELLEEEREHQDRRAHLAIEMFCKRVRQAIGAYLTELPACQAVIFTGGIGENAPIIRQRICDQLKHLGIELDDAVNRLTAGSEAIISAKSSRIQVICIPTNEELLITRDTIRCLKARHAPV
jgi:acetate kinase